MHSKRGCFLMRGSSIEMKSEFRLWLIQSPDAGFGCFEVNDKAEWDVQTAQAIHFEDAVFPGHDHENSGFCPHPKM
jgi:hypothetical protein